MFDTSYHSVLWTFLAVAAVIVGYLVFNWISKEYRAVKARNVVTVDDFNAYAQAAEADLIEEAPRKVASN